jgi:hypothetical protein
VQRPAAPGWLEDTNKTSACQDGAPQKGKIGNLTRTYQEAVPGPQHVMLRRRLLLALIRLLPLAWHLAVLGDGSPRHCLPRHLAEPQPPRPWHFPRPRRTRRRVYPLKHWKPGEHPIREDGRSQKNPRFTRFKTTSKTYPTNMGWTRGYRLSSARLEGSRSSSPHSPSDWI